jgi:glyoxylase-like metal-dependent hydrolase (beta-lactamase superfamily II)
MHAEDFRIHVINGYIQDTYLVEYSDKILLLDGGSRPDVPIIEDFITKKLGRKMSDLRLILVSHMHPDHAGAAPFLREKYGTLIAAYHEVDDWYAGAIGALQHLLDSLMAYFVVYKSKKPFKNIRYPRFLKPDILLYDNDSIPFFNDWRVKHAPGHTSHQVVFYHAQKQILYAADTVLKVNTYCVLPFPINLRSYAVITLQKLSELKIQKVLLAHGGICENREFSDLFISLIPKLYNDLKPPMNLLRYVSGFPKPIKEYLAMENNSL